MIIVAAYKTAAVPPYPFPVHSVLGSMYYYKNDSSLTDSIRFYPWQCYEVNCYEVNFLKSSHVFHQMSKNLWLLRN